MNIRSFSALPLVLVAAPAFAQANAAPQTPTTIVVTGSPVPVTQVGQSVSQISRADIDAVQGSDLVRVLERLPGVSFARNGGPGAQTSLFVRGGDSDQLLVLIDGVRVADLASPGGNYDTGPLALTSISHIELLRGSNSVVWGSQAMAGVLAITTRAINGAEATAEYGAYNTTSLAATAGIKRDGYGFSLDAGHVHSDGFAPVVGDKFNGGLNSWRIGARGEIELAQGLTLKANARTSDAKLGIDQFGSFANQLTRDTSGGASLDYATGPLRLSAAATLAEVRRHYVDTPFPSDYFGLEERLTLTGNLALPLHLRLDFGGEHEWTRAFDTYDTRHTARIESGHALLGYYSDGFSLAVGGRIDSHDRFGSHWTGGANGMVRLADNLRARAAYGEGFKAPSLYQLYAGFGTGNPGLKPETSRSYEAGLEQGDRAHGFFASATWFRRDTSNLIYYNSSSPAANYFSYSNAANARVVGLELEAGADLGQTLRVAGNYTWQSPVDVLNHRDLARRPRHTVNLAADWKTPVKGLSLGGDLRIVSSSIDYNSAYNVSVPPIHTLASNVTATLRASVAVSDRLELFGRIENIGDATYQTAFGYNTPGRSATVGLRAKL